jgi:glutathione S-transferase
MYELYIANKNYSSWSLRPWLLMRELRIPFEERLKQFVDGGSQAAFRAFSPTGKVPCLRDGDTVVWDSLAIAEYLAERHQGVWPTDAKARAWARSASAEMHSGFMPLRDACSMSCGVRIKLHKVSDGLSRDIARVNELWNEGLKRFGGPFLAGKAVSAVDAFFGPVAFRVQTYGLKLESTPAAYAALLLALPSMQDWYKAALAERWREKAHEEEILATGTLLEDFRARP